jgi:PAS domain S-box-containing protein
MDAHGKVAVLVVNDRTDALTALSAVLQPLGVEVVTAISAAEGLRIARERELAVAIVDIRMPEIDGFEMVETLRSDRAMRALPVIFVSAADPTAKIRKRVYALGAADFVPLPAAEEELRSKVAVFVELHRQKKALMDQARIINRVATSAAREQRERFHLFMETASDYGMFFMDPGGRVQEWTAGAEKLLGYVESEATGRHCRFIFLPEDQQAGVPEREIVDAEQLGQALDERWHARKNGERFYAIGRLIALRDESGLRGFVKIFRDATAAKQSEARLREALERFESLAETMAQLAWMSDPEGARFWFNRRYFEYTGTTLEEVQGWQFVKVYHPDEREQILADLRETLARGTTGEGKWRIRGKDGQYRWFLTQAAPVKDDEGRVVRWFGTNTDIHEQVLLQQELQSSEQKFREIFETANEGIWILDADARIEMVNQRMAEMLGYPPSEIIGKLKTDFVLPEDVPYVRRLFEERRRGLVAAVDVRFRRKDGAPIWTLLSARPLIRDGRFAGALDMFTDISARKDAARQFEDELKSQVAHRTAALNEKTRQLESFAYTIAHDLRSPLRAISGYAEFTIDDYRAQLPAGAVANLEKIMASAARLDTLIRDLLSYTRVSQVEFAEEDVPLRSSIDWAIEQLRSEIAARKARIDVPAELPAVRGERSIVDQVFLNLFSNAIKFVAPGQEPRIAVGFGLRDGMVRVTVQDNGVGVPPEYHERIFRVFERLQGSYRFSGTGVGLAIVARAAERLGGRAGVESEPGKGSTFWVEFRKGNS